MGFGGISRGLLSLLLLMIVAAAGVLRPCAADDIVHDDSLAPTQPGCSNSFVLVKIRNWIKGDEAAELVGVSARFGKPITNHEQEAQSSPLTKLDPEDGCTQSKPIQGFTALVKRGNCTFTTKARVAQAAGAVAILVVNDKQELYKMVCANNGTFKDITIPSVMLPRAAGSSLEGALALDEEVRVLLYSPKRPLVDIAEVFLWLMAVGTILGASFWSAWTAKEAAQEHYRRLKAWIAGLPRPHTLCF